MMNEKPHRGRMKMSNSVGNRYTLQCYKSIVLRLIDRKDYSSRKAKRFTIQGTNQNVWIPNKHLTDRGMIKPYENIDYVFRAAKRQLNLAGVRWSIPGIKQESEEMHHVEKRRDICMEQEDIRYEVHEIERG